MLPLSVKTVREKPPSCAAWLACCPPGADGSKVAGRILSAWKRRELARRIAFLGSAYLHGGELTAGELITISRYSYPSRRPASERISFGQICQDLDIERLCGRKAATLSSGELQKIHLASVVYQNTDILLLDEPLARIDPAFRRTVKKFLKTLKDAGVTMLAILHDPNDVLDLSDQVIAIADTAITCYRHPQEFCCPDSLRATYGSEFDIIRHPRSGAPVVLSP